MLRVIITSILLFFVSQYIICGADNAIPRKKVYIIYNFLTIFCFYSLLNIFLWQYEINFIIVTFFVLLLSIVMYYVHEFRGTNLNCSDILSINTAKEVAGGYKYEVKPEFIVVAVFIIADIFIQIFVYKIDINANYHKAINGVESLNIDKYRFFWHEIGQVLLFFISFFILKDKISKEKFDYSLNAGENEGYIYNFVSSIPIFHRSEYNILDSINAARDFVYRVFTYEHKKNVNYSTQSKYRKYADVEKDSPHVIVIMNESFGTLHNRIKTNIPATPFYDGLSGVIKGNLYVNTFGGGTANTEFEFLTGMTVGNFPYPVMPYNNFVKRDKYSIARLFNNLGYKTIAMHPYTATNYHRDRVYKYFGFDERVFINDMNSKSYIRNFVSDKSMYEEVIRRYVKTKNEERKLFLFGVTVQNHSGYLNLEGEKILTYTHAFNNRDALDSYMTLIRKSDDALSMLINYFEKEEDHVVVLFFGDHNASFGTEINKKYYDNDINYEFSNAYETPFFIYDNKKKVNKTVKSISANFLSVELLKSCQLPFDMLHHLLSDEYKIYNTYNYHKARQRGQNVIVDIPFDELMKLEKEYLK